MASVVAMPMESLDLLRLLGAYLWKYIDGVIEMLNYRIGSKSEVNSPATACHSASNGRRSRQVQRMHYVSTTKDPSEQFPLRGGSRFASDPLTSSYPQCDEGKPDCERCLKSGRQCEGFDRFPTFLNQTVDGPQKRFGLEEAKPRTTTGTSSSAVSSRRSSPGQSRSRRITRSRTHARAAGSTLSRQPSNSELVDSQLISQFWKSFAPIETSSSQVSPCRWLQWSLEVTRPTVALGLSIKALSLTRLGWQNEDVALSTRGRTMYGNALKELQKALWTEDLMWLDETFAAAYTLSVYEVSAAHLAPPRY